MRACDDGLEREFTDTSVPLSSRNVAHVDLVPSSVSKLRRHDETLREVFGDEWTDDTDTHRGTSDTFEAKLREPEPEGGTQGHHFFASSWASLGVVFGDIGTSPIYTFPSMFAFVGDNPSEAHVKGGVSLVLWSVLLVVTYKYVILVLTAGFHGKGGAFALVSQLMQATKNRRARELLVFLSCVALSMIVADGVITPIMSVLSAVEGVLIPAPQLGIAFTNPVAIFIVLSLYVVQRFGVAVIGFCFSPVLLLWFISLAGFGALWVARAPDIFEAFNPWMGIDFIITNGVQGWLNLAFVVLSVTGGEAMYADRGHFGPNPIRLAWFVVVLPALLLNYLGQGALLLLNPTKSTSPFFYMIEGSLYWPMFVLSILATIIASQSVISALFTLSQQAVSAKVLPRLLIVHTSRESEGQVYVPVMNWFMAGLGIAILIGFKTSAALTATFGFTVSFDMLLTSILFCFILHKLWKWHIVLVIAMMMPVVVLEIGFLTATCAKIPTGAWFTVVVATVSTGVCFVWHRGSVAVSQSVSSSCIDVEEWITQDHFPRINRFFFFLTEFPIGVPQLLRDFASHTDALPSQMAIVSVRIARIPRVRFEDRFVVETMQPGLWRVILTFGFQERVDFGAACLSLEELGLPLQPNLQGLTFVLSRVTITADPNKLWYHRVMMSIFIVLHLLEYPAYLDYTLPPKLTMEIGEIIVC